MRILLLILFLANVFLLSAQTGTEALFKKGTELEYRTYMVKPNLKRELTEVTRITLIVTDVKDSNNVTYSYITKQGRAAKNPSMGYEKRFVITKQGDKVTLPMDLYMADTVYNIDVGIKGTKAKHYATARIKGNANYVISGSIADGSFDSYPKTVVIEGGMLSMDINQASVNFGDIIKSKWEVEATAKSYKVGPKTKVKTEAGTFECYKITSVTEVKVMGHKMETTTQVFYSPEYGFLKTEPGENDQNGGVELIRVKKAE